MVHELAPIDISKTGVPSLVDVVEDVRRTNRPRILRQAGEDIAVISPIKKAAKRPSLKRPLFKQRSQADIEAFLSSAGGWEDIVDTDKLKAGIEASHRLPIRPRPEL